MFRYSFFSVTLFLIFESLFLNFAVGQKRFVTPRSEDSDRTKVEEITRIQKESDQLKKETDQLNLEKARLDEEIEKTQNKCDEDIASLQRQQKEVEEKLEENKKNMVVLLKKIQEEEAEHVRLEAELKMLYEVLTLHEYQHIIVYGDLKLMERRRNNGTTDRCNEVSLSLREESEEALLTRAHLINPHKPRKPKITDHDMKLRVLAATLDINQILKLKLKNSVEDSQRALNAIIQQCNTRKSNMDQLTKETHSAMDTSLQSLEVLDKDLKDLIKFSEAVRLEIKTGKSFLYEIKQKISAMKKLMNNYRDDLACFNSIKSMD